MLRPVILALLRVLCYYAAALLHSIVCPSPQSRWLLRLYVCPFTASVPSRETDLSPCGHVSHVCVCTLSIGRKLCGSLYKLCACASSFVVCVYNVCVHVHVCLDGREMHVYD